MEMEVFRDLLLMGFFEIPKAKQPPGAGMWNRETLCKSMGFQLISTDPTSTGEFPNRISEPRLVPWEQPLAIWHTAPTLSVARTLSFLVWHGLRLVIKTGGTKDFSTNWVSSPFRYSFSGCSCDVQDYFEILGMLDFSFKSTIGNWFFKKPWNSVAFSRFATQPLLHPFEMVAENTLILEACGRKKMFLLNRFISWSEDGCCNS